MSVVNKYITLPQLEATANDIINKVKDKHYLESANLPSYTIKKQQVADTGYAATYQLFSVLGSGASAIETAVGEKINIPKDMVISDAEIKVVDTPDEPYAGAQVGDKYIDWTIANADNTHVYLPVNELVDVYTGGNGIVISNSNVVSVDIDSTEGHGLGITNGGKLKLDIATPDVYSGGTKTSDGTAGAMSSADKYKLDNADVTAYTAGNGIDITSHAVSVEIDSSNANGLAATANGVALATAVADTWGGVQATGTYVAGTTYYTTAACTTEVDTSDFVVGETDVSSYYVYQKTADGSNGAFTSADKAKLDSFTAATNAEVDAMIATLDNL